MSDDTAPAQAIEQETLEAMESMDLPTPNLDEAVIETAIVNLRVDGGLIEVELAVADDGKLFVEAVELFPNTY